MSNVRCAENLMSLGYELNDKPPRLVVHDENRRRLTDTDTIDKLFAGGLQFEAACALRKEARFASLAHRATRT